MREFSFSPYSRLDEFMVSYANDGGGGECMTYSIAPRAAPAQERAEQFLMFLAERM